MGQQIFDLVNRDHDADFHQVTWSGKDNVGNTVPSGFYFYRVTTKDESLTGKMLLMK
jgi:flagellar hook assembly protein FlgD